MALQGSYNSSLDARPEDDPPTRYFSAISRIRSSMRNIFVRSELEEESTFEVFCDQGHLMSARIMREVYGPLCGTLRQKCHSCDTQVKKTRGCYRCHTCNLAYCMPCAIEQASAQPMEATSVSIGDIILTGPFATVTHVILATSQMLPADEFYDTLKVPDGFELYTCNTIEISPLVAKGRLHRGQYFFQRDPGSGSVTVAGSRDFGSQCPPLPDHQDTMFLLHPFRKGHGGPKIFDESKFQEAIRATEESLGGYGINTVVKVFLDLPHQRASLDPATYPTTESKKALMAELRRRWLRHPICVSLAIIAWQRYFELLHADKGEKLDVAAVEDIFQWMPLKCDQSYPSNLVKVLTAKKWIMRGDFCDSGPGISFHKTTSDVDDCLMSERLDSESSTVASSRPHQTMLPNLLHVAGREVGKSNCSAREISSLSASEVEELLITRAGIPEELASNFLKEDVDGEALLELTEEDLQLLGVALVGQRKRILRLLRVLTKELTKEFEESGRMQVML